MFSDIRSLVREVFGEKLHRDSLSDSSPEAWAWFADVAPFAGNFLKKSDKVVCPLGSMLPASEMHCVPDLQGFE